MAKNPKAADRASVPVSGSEGAPAASAAVAAPDTQPAAPTSEFPDPAIAAAAAEAAAEAELRRIEDEALAEAERDAAAVAAAAEARAIAREGKVLLLAPADVSGASAGGVEYQVDDEGTIAVDPEHVPALLEHGFQRAE
jgi:hypothetical protein